MRTAHGNGWTLGPQVGRVMTRRLLARIANGAAAVNSLVGSQIRSTDRNNPGARMAGKDAYRVTMLDESRPENRTMTSGALLSARRGAAGRSHSAASVG